MQVALEYGAAACYGAAASGGSSQRARQQLGYSPQEALDSHAVADGVTERLHSAGLWACVCARQVIDDVAHGGAAGWRARRAHGERMWAQV